ncbi:hypothetical protein ACIP66_02795 [Pseudomonas sp. NPDC088429]|uniref:hypothetical protein n=1 Tax=Pseudomonas sp. NPDC088429 TaxID=3364455 RepID=UPI003811BFD9
MSLAMTIVSMIAAWTAIAISMLWGVLRIARRHHPLAQCNAVAQARYKRLPKQHALLFRTA